jgi:hypothetical protein
MSFYLGLLTSGYRSICGVGSFNLSLSESIMP